jgi:membrane protein
MTKLSGSQTELGTLAKSLLPSLRLFTSNDPLRMAGATAFFTTFALPPIVFLLVQLFGIFFGKKEMGRGLLENISHVLGEQGAGQVRQVIRSIRGFDYNWYVIVPGCLFLFFIATTLFNVIRGSLDQLWGTTVKKKPGFLFGIAVRLRSFAVILVVGILFFADILLESFQLLAGNYVAQLWPGISRYFTGVMDEIASVIIVSSWFIILFRFLADARPVWKAAIAGGILTGILFTLGRVILRVILIDSNVGEIYGTSGSLVLVLLFVFYSSFILYYGAAFVFTYSSNKKWPIKLNDRAELVNTYAKN